MLIVSDKLQSCVVEVGHRLAFGGSIGRSKGKTAIFASHFASPGVPLVPWIRDSLKKVSVRLLRAETESAHLSEDLVSGLGPLEGLSLLIVGVDVGGDRSTKLRNTGVRSSPKGLLGEQAEEALNEIEPRRVCRREVQLETRVSSQPPPDDRRLVGGEVVTVSFNLFRFQGTSRTANEDRVAQH